MSHANDKHPLQELLESIAEEEGSWDVRSYVGRGMYGSECLAITINSMAKFLQFLVEYSSALGSKDAKDTIVDALGKYQQDSMGRGLVLYFPGIDYCDVE